MNTPSEIGPIIEQLMDSPLFKKRWTEYLINSSWTEWVGGKMAQHIKPGTLNGDKLSVLIDDDRWAKAFEDLKDKVLEKIDLGLGNQTVKDFIIRMEKKSPANKMRKKGTKDQIDNPLTCQSSGLANKQTLSKRVEDDLNLIKDPDVRAALRRIIIKSKPFNLE